MLIEVAARGVLYLREDEGLNASVYTHQRGNRQFETKLCKVVWSEHIWPKATKLLRAPLA